MKRFKFTLQSLLTVRRFLKMEAAGVLAEKSRSRQFCASLLESGREQLQSIEKGLQQAFTPNVLAGEILMIQKALMEQRRTVAELDSRYRDAIQKESEARKAVLSAQKDYEALIKLEERQREMAMKEAERENELAMQEFVAAQHVLLKGR